MDHTLRHPCPDLPPGRPSDVIEIGPDPDPGPPPLPEPSSVPRAWPTTEEGWRMIGVRLFSRRCKLKLSPQDLADRARVNLGTVRLAQSGRMRNVKLLTVLTLALGESVDWLLAP